MGVINSTNGCPFACRTILGWTVHGTRHTSRDHMTSAKTSISLDQQLIQMYNHEFSESTAEDMPQNSIEDAHFLRCVDESISLRDGHYQIGLPMKRSVHEESHNDIPNNRLQAEQRASHLKRKFNKLTKTATSLKTTRRS